MVKYSVMSGVASDADNAQEVPAAFQGTALARSHTCIAKTEVTIELRILTSPH
jgi:hypothetical protein